ncbi:SepM family pheromone-processing serine protease [Priestia koreensis]|uniref:endopeptidase La n=1 Tax=Priestia koreensis TaxID=284581 RepID=A0A0M0KPH1_9BACI|nr:SepM family pheromone-processing serine protease [Priestia koreensis]KOO40756.1 hypothetical protein AMD01_20850 [Priestia koreensis]
MKKNKLFTLSLVLGIILAFVIVFFPLPYYITKPGMAQKLDPIIDVQGGTEEKGDFMLTTVRMGKATPLSYTLAHIQDFQEVFPEKDIRQEGESDKDYNYRQLHLMETSKQSAIVVAYQKADKQIEFHNKGVYIMSVVPKMPAEKVLKAGDRVHKVDGKAIQTADEFISFVSQKKKGDAVSITYDRNGKMYTKSVKIQPFPGLKNKVGLGITLITDRDITETPKVKINTEQIGGPSAGLMFSLEIYNQLVEEDTTHGYQIAGTGTINDEGIVGPIGGISQKIVAASDSGAEIFFAPAEGGRKDSNYNEAVKTAKKIDTKMKIIPVNTFDDAIAYLNKLKDKK